MRDEREFEDFYAAVFDRLVGQLYLVTGNLQDAEDVVQEALTRAAVRWSRLRRYRVPEAWVRRVAMNLASDRFRRVRRRLAVTVRLRVELESRQPPPAEVPGLTEALAPCRWPSARPWSSTTCSTCRSTRSPWSSACPWGRSSRGWPGPAARWRRCWRPRPRQAGLGIRGWRQPWMTCGTGWPSWPSGRPGRGPGAAATLRRARARRRWTAGGRVALSLLLVLGLGFLTSRLLADRESPPQITTPPPDATPQQASPLWTAEAAAPGRSSRGSADRRPPVTSSYPPPATMSRPGSAPRRSHRAAAVDLPDRPQRLRPGRRERVGDRGRRLRAAHRARPGHRQATLAVRARILPGGGVRDDRRDTLFIGTSFPSEGAVDPPVVYALDLATGRQRWRTVLDRGTDLQWAAPVVHGGQVLVADTLSHPGSAPTSHLHALDAGTGQLRWKADLHADQQGFFAEPPVVAGGLVYVATASRRLLALEVDSGREVWRTSGFPVVAGVRNGLVLAVIEDRLAALDAGSGVRRWEVPVRGGGEHWPVLEGDTVYVASADDVIAVDATAGTTRWRVPVEPDRWSAGPGRGATVRRHQEPSARPGRLLRPVPLDQCQVEDRERPLAPQTAWWSPPPTAPCSGSPQPEAPRRDRQATRDSARRHAALWSTWVQRSII